MALAGRHGVRHDSGMQTFAPLEKGASRDIAAKSVGWSDRCQYPPGCTTTRQVARPLGNPYERLNIEQKMTILGMVRLMVRVIIFCS